MTTVTFVGAGGGVGTTTLAALTLHLLAENRVPLPAVNATDPGAFDQRSGLQLAPALAGSHELIDGGRYDAQKAASAFARGYLVLVAAHTRQGMSALTDSTADIAARFGADAHCRTVPVVTSVFGRRPATPHEMPVQMRLPFDPSLAAGGPLHLAVPHLRAGTKTALRQRWTPWVLETFAFR
ncbi:hypothetical protein [Microbacterium sp. NPDC087665]|uniref:hypothetical protein n=1 Tax=Microbacterium sp. NPDC087665 TaxID=3364194 RepID=UPI00380068C2